MHFLSPVLNTFSVAQSNIRKVTKRAHKPLSYFRAEPIQLSDGSYSTIIKTNGIARRLFYAFFSTQAVLKRQQQDLIQALHSNVVTISQLPPQAFV